MQHMMMKFGLCHLVVLDNITPFKGSFIATCQVLNLNYNILTKWNHKGFYVEYFHRFLKKTVTITVKERGTNNIFVPTSISADYS